MKDGYLGISTTFLLTYLIRSQQPRQTHLQCLDGFPRTIQDRAQARNILRSHAARSRWRARAKRSSHDDDDSPVAIARNSLLSTRLYTIGPVERDGNIYELVNWEQQTALLASQRQPLERTPLPLPLPPEVHCIGGLGDREVRDVLHHVYVLLDLIFIPSIMTGSNSDAIALMQRIISERLFANVFTFTQLVRELATKVHIGADRERALYRCLGEAIQMINRRLSHHATAIDDDTVLAVLCLAFHDPNIDVQKTLTHSSQTQSPSQGPLKSLRMLDIYGGPVNVAPVHLRGLSKILELRDGVGTLQIPGLAQTVAYGDLIISSRELQCPYVPFYATYESALEPQLQKAARPDHPLRNLGRGFDVLDRLADTHRSGSISLPSLKTVLARLTWYTMAVDDHLAARVQALPLPLLGDHRNFVQHSLMCLAPKEGQIQIHEPDVFDLCLLSIFIYSFLSIFPLPAAPFDRLARHIKTSLLSSRRFSAEYTRAPRLMLWIVTMGAIASVGDPAMRTWFLAVLQRCLRDLGVGDVQGLRDVLAGFPWFARTSERDVDDLWGELRSLDPFGSDAEGRGVPVLLRK